jgi:hypothetical protein
MVVNNRITLTIDMRVTLWVHDLLIFRVPCVKADKWGSFRYSHRPEFITTETLLLRRERKVNRGAGQESEGIPVRKFQKLAHVPLASRYCTVKGIHRSCEIPNAEPAVPHLPELLVTGLPVMVENIESTPLVQTGITPAQI